MTENRRVRLLSGVAAGYLNAAVTTSCNMLAVPLYVHYLRKEDYGLWLVVLSLIGPLSLTGLGFPTITQNRVGEAKARGDWNQVNCVLTTGLVLLTVATTFASALLLAASKTGIFNALLKGSINLRSTATAVVIVSTCGYLLAQPLQVFRFCFRAFEMVDVEQRCQSVLAVVYLLALALTLSWGGGVLAVAVLFASLQVLSGLFYAFYLTWKIPAVSLSFKSISMKEGLSMISPGLHFFVVSLGLVLIWNVDNLVISGVLGVVYVTAFAIATRLTTVPQGIFAVVCAAAAPTITALNAQKKNEPLQRLVLIIMKLSVAAALIYGTEMTFFGRSFIALWAGKSVVIDLPTFLVLVGVLVFHTLITMPYFVVIATSRHKTYAYASVAEGVLNLGLSYWWAHTLGVIGVALGTLVAIILISGWYLPYAGMQVTGLTLSRVVRACVLPPLPAGAISIALGVLLHPYAHTWPGFIGSTSITLAAFVLFYGLFALGSEEKDVLRRTFRGAGVELRWT